MLWHFGGFGLKAVIDLSNETVLNQEPFAMRPQR
jgi:hypothetical protein